MFFLAIDWTGTALSALIGMLLALAVLFVIFLVLRLCGFRFFFQRNKNHEVNTATSAKEDVIDHGSELSEEELVVILTAAVMAASGDSDPGRFRVVAFRRV